MDNQQALQALLDGKKIRQIDWKPGEFIEREEKLVLNPETSELTPTRRIIFHNFMGLLADVEAEQMQACLDRNIEFEEYEPPTEINGYPI